MALPDLMHQASEKGWSCFSVGGAVTRLTLIRQTSDAIRAGKIASRSLRMAGTLWWIKGVSQKIVMMVPAAMLATAAAAVARFQKKAARITGVSAAE